MDACDVLIVGGGPAGSSCARRLGAAGLDVVLIDKAILPRTKPCAGWVVPTVFDELGLGLTEYGAARVLQPVTGFRTGLIGGRMVETDYGRPVSYGILRREFDDFLLRRSQARVREGLYVTRIARAPDGWIVNDEIRARVLVGAGGHFCPVARHLNGAPEPADVVAAQEMEFDLDEHPRFTCTARPEVPLICLCRDLKGYGWCVRKGTHLNLGLGRQDPVQLNRHVMEFVRFLQQRGVIEGELPSPWRGHAYLLRQDASRRLVDDGLLLVGDAAGLAVPGSGEGIRPAIESGLLAAEAILAAAGRYQRERLEAAYAGPLRRTNPVRRRGSVGRSLLSPVAGTLLSTRWFARHVLLNHGFLHPTARPRSHGTRVAPIVVEGAAPKEDDAPKTDGGTPCLRRD